MVKTVENGKKITKLINEQIMPLARDLRTKVYEKAGIGNLSDRQIKVIKIVGQHPDGIPASELTQEGSRRLKKSGLSDSAGVSTVGNAVKALQWDLHYLEKVKLPPPVSQKLTYVRLTKAGQTVYQKLCEADAARSTLFASAASKDTDVIIAFLERAVNLMQKELED